MIKRYTPEEKAYLREKIQSLLKDITTIETNTKNPAGAEGARRIRVELMRITKQLKDV